MLAYDILCYDLCDNYEIQFFDFAGLIVSYSLGKQAKLIRVPVCRAQTAKGTIKGANSGTHWRETRCSQLLRFSICASTRQEVIMSAIM
jgi:hypothetical protein